MNRDNSNKTYAALGLAGQAGCLAVVLAVGALLVGLWLDQTFGTRRTFALICVVVSVPVNLFITLRITQMLIARVIPPDVRVTAEDTSSEVTADHSDPQ